MRLLHINPDHRPGPKWDADPSRINEWIAIVGLLVVVAALFFGTAVIGYGIATLAKALGL